MANHKDVDNLAIELHSVYKKAAEKMGKNVIPEKWEDVSEEIKEFDRTISRYILDKFMNPAESQPAESHVGSIFLDENSVVKKLGGSMLGAEEISVLYGKTIGIGSGDGVFTYLKKDEAIALANWIKEKCKCL